MTTIKIDTNNDLAIENNDLVFLTKTEEVAQVLKHELRTFAAEWFLDESIGLPYYEEIYVKNADPARLDAIFKEKILNTPGVIELISFTLDLTGRGLSLSFTAKAIDGIIDFSEVL